MISLPNSSFNGKCHSTGMILVTSDTYGIPRQQYAGRCSVLLHDQGKQRMAQKQKLLQYQQ